MPTYFNTLGAFVQPVCICERADLEQSRAQVYRNLVSEVQALSDSLSGKSVTQLVVMDSHRQPLGAVSLLQLFTHVSHLEDPLAAHDIESLLIPIECLCAETSLSQFWLHLQNDFPRESTLWGIKESETGQFLGLVDVPRLLPAIAQSNINTPLNSVAQQAQATQLTLERQGHHALLNEISHELKNPLTALLGLLNIFQHSHLGPLTERQQHYLALINQKSDQLMAVVKDVLRLSEARDQRLVLRPDVVEIRSLCEQAVAIAVQPIESLALDRSPAQPSDVQLDIDPHLPALIADRDHLEYSLVALLRHHLSVNHPVTLAVKPFGGWVRFTVSGSDPLTLGQSSMGMASQRRYGASLYSLKQSVADHLAHLHYGTIVTSSATETSLIMPPNLAAIRTDSALIKQLSERIVVVVAVTGKETTEPLLASDMQLLTSALKVQGYQAVVVPSGLEAIAAVKQLQPAAIFLVLSTPQPLSWPMCLLLKNSVRQAPMVVVGDVSQQQAAQAGVDHVLSLPLTNGAISQCLSELLGFPTTTMINGRPRWGSEDAQNTLVKPLSPIQPPAKLTVLHLETASQRTQSTRITALSQRLNLHGCRVIAIESFEEAELLIPIWKPRIILYTSPDAAPLQRLVQNSPLFELPFVITHPQVATQARQLRDLVVYECPQSPEADLAALVTVIQIAADKTSTFDRSPRL